ncbi:hypothetical protein [Aquincola sp. J276]|uniref:hypothetical protein n=1 Tax=Aquincola sp. J276 TaxID=2898432 RepID=UPI0021509997|nr:hypothetical protein [Aquincola sp. J276]MCR5864076.1 hypothetical protein [Aquincola sp. J276]
MTVAHWSILVTITLALVGYVASYSSSLLHARRKERLELVTKQLNDFYGPLYLSTRSSAIAYAAYVKKQSAGPSPANAMLAEPQALREWRSRVKEVLMPMNLLQETIILNSAHLIREPQVPGCLLQLMAHIAAWKAVLKKWQMDDFSDQFSLIPYPRGVEEYVAAGFKELKAEQLRLMGR